MDKLIKILKKIIRIFFNIRGQKRLNVSKTLYINFKTQKFSDAIRLPIIIRGKCTIIGARKGSIHLNIIRTGIIRVGYNEGFGNEKGGTRFRLTGGKLHFLGRATICTDAVIENYGQLEIGDNVFIGNSARLFCHNQMIIGDNVSITLECQVFDTNFHYVRNIESGQVYKRWGLVKIGKKVWIGNRTTVMNGSIIPPFSIVASNSLVNKDLSEYGDGSFFAGNPAKYKFSGMTRLFDINTEITADNHFRKQPDSQLFSTGLSGYNISEICWE